MKFDELITKVRTMAQDANISGTDFLAVQVNITGKDEGKALEFPKLIKK